MINIKMKQNLDFINKGWVSKSFLILSRSRFSIVTFFLIKNKLDCGLSRWKTQEISETGHFFSYLARVMLRSHWFIQTGNGSGGHCGNRDNKQVVARNSRTVERWWLHPPKWRPVCSLCLIPCDCSMQHQCEFPAKYDVVIRIQVV